MVERAGPTNQDGIFYQNSIAAQYLADLLNLQQLPPRETVVEVRVEAPAHVDDIVVRYADGHRDWIQAKSNLQRSGDAWTSLWEAFVAQSRDPVFGADDRLVIALGRRGVLADTIQALAERAQSAEHGREWRSRLNDEAASTLKAVENCLPNEIDILHLFRRISLQVATLTDVEAMFRRLDLGSATAVPKQLLALLRDLIGNDSRLRGTFRAPALRKRLVDQFGVDVFEPREWGLAAYRDAVRRMARVEIPGRGISVPVEDIFVWPKASRLNSSNEKDFEDETPRWDVPQNDNKVDLSRFPAEGLDRCVLVAGPGFGKSTLIAAIAAKLSFTPVVPAEVSLGAFALTDDSVLEYLERRVNRDYAVRIDWRRLAEQGLLCVLFDGLDEVPTDKRSGLIRRIALFSSRFSNVPWILTVRDPAVLSGPIDAELIELQPLHNNGIYELVGKFKAWSPQLDQWKFTDDLQAYPDIARFARIPLFLSIMLARWSPSSPLPKKRSDLIEVYLASLFDSDTVIEERDSVAAPSGLRSIAQAIAFTCLEGEEIGLSDRQALQIVGNYLEGPRDIVLSQLLANGILRRSIDGRLQFPYPIVQEYLAAIHLVDFAPDQLARRINLIARRPWAQVLQFALELVDDASSHVRESLSMRDDVFSSNLRLVGRCVANGATVDAQLKDEIGTKLAQVWAATGYQTRQKVGRLIVDSFSRPLHSEVRKCLGLRWLLTSGAFEIVSKANDRTLTLEVVAQLLEGKLDSLMSLHGLKAALQSVACDVAKLVVDRARRDGTTDEQLWGMAEFLELVRLDESSSKLLLPLAEAKDMPLVIRFAAYSAMAGAPPPSILAMAKAALGDDHWRPRSASLMIFARAEPISETFSDILADSSIMPGAKEYLLQHIDRIIPDKSKRADVVRHLLDTLGLPSRHYSILKVWAMGAGDRNRFIELLDVLDELDGEVARAVLVNLNRFPERQLGELARSKMQGRAIPDVELPSFLQSAMTGLTSTIENFGWGGYSIKSGPIHPAFHAWIELFDEWRSVPNLTKVQRLRVVESMLDIRPELISELQSLVFSVGDPDDNEWEEDDYGHHLRGAMDNLRRRHVEIPFDLAERFALAKRPNVPYAGIAAIAAVPSRYALGRLISLYQRIKRSNRSVVLEAIDVLSTRLDVRIMPEHLDGSAPLPD